MRVTSDDERTLEFLTKSVRIMRDKQREMLLQITGQTVCVFLQQYAAFFYGQLEYEGNNRWRVSSVHHAPDPVATSQFPFMLHEVDDVKWGTKIPYIHLKVIR